MKNKLLVFLLAAGFSVPLLHGGSHAGPLDRVNMGPRVNPLTNKMFAVPGVIGQDCDMALTTIQASQLNPSLTEMRKRDDRYKGREGRIVSQTPSPGGMAMIGSTVSITCYRGEPDEDNGSSSGYGSDSGWGRGGGYGWDGQQDAGPSWSGQQEDSGWGSGGGASGGTGQDGQDESPSWGGQGWPPPPSTDGQTESTSTSQSDEPSEETATAQDGPGDEGQSGEDAPFPVRGGDSGKDESSGKDENSGQIEPKKGADKLLIPKPVIRGGQGLKVLPNKGAAPSAVEDKAVSTPAGGELKLDMKSPLSR